MKFSKVRPVKSPERGTSLSAGIDFYVPEFKESFIKDLINKNPHINSIKSEKEGDITEIVLVPQERILIPSGIHVNLTNNKLVGLDALAAEPDLDTNSGIALIAHNKSGVGTKLGLDRLAEVVDEDYQGEVHISVVNTGRNSITIKPNQKLIQFLLIPVLYDMPSEVNFDELYTTNTLRGDKGFGQGTGQ